MSKKEQVETMAPESSFCRKTSPKTAPIFDVAGDVEVARRNKPSRCRRCAVCCCACCAATAIAFGLLVLVLAVTVFKVKDPVMTMNSVAVDGVDVGFAAERSDLPLSVNASVTADISIENPNAASFRFQNSTTEFYYREQTVGVARAPSGNARARRTVRMNVTVDVFADRAVRLAAAAFPNMTLSLRGLLTGDAISVDLRSYTEVRGQVSVWRIYKRRIAVRMNCTMTLVYVLFGTQEITNKICRATVS